MGEVVRFRKARPGDRAKGKTLCRHGFHKWKLDKGRQFDVKQGKLLTVYRCQRCGAVKNKAE